MNIFLRKKLVGTFVAITLIGAMGATLIVNQYQAQLFPKSSPVGDVAISVTGPGLSKPGDIVAYQVPFINKGPSPVDFDIVASVPPGLEFTNVLPLLPGCVQNNEHTEVRCPFRSWRVQVGGTANFYYRVIEKNCVPSIDVNIHVEMLPNNIDPDLSNNQASAHTAVSCAVVRKGDVSLSVSGPYNLSDGSAATEIKAGDSIYYGISAKNNGPDPVSFDVPGDVPDGLTYTKPANCLPGRKTCIYNRYLSLAAGQTGQSIAAIYTVNAAAACESSIDLPYHIAMLPTDTDPALANNQASVHLDVDCSPANADTSPLLIRLQKMPATATVVKNQKTVSMLQFDAKALSQDIGFTNLQFEAKKGKLTNFTNYALRADTDGDGKTDLVVSKGTVNGTTLVFNSFLNGTYVLPVTKTQNFEIVADAVSSFSDPKIFALGFKASDPNYVEAKKISDGISLMGIRTDGTCATPNCDISVYTITGNATEFTLVNQGNLYVTQSVNRVPNRQLLGGVLSDPILRLNLLAEDEDIDVTELQFTNTGGSLASIDRLELSLPGGAAPFAFATGGSCGTETVPPNTYCAKMNNRNLVVPKNASVEVLVRAHLTTDQGSAVPAEKIQISLSGKAVSNETTGEGAVHARGDSSSTTLLANNGDGNKDGEIFIGRYATAGANATIVGTKHVSVLSKIVSIANASPEADGSQVPSGLSDIAQFKFTAAPNNNNLNGRNIATLSDIILRVEATNVTLANMMAANTFSFYNKANSTVAAPCTAMNLDGTPMAGKTITGNFLVRCSNLKDQINTQISQGTDETFVLRGTISNPKTSFTESSLQVSLTDFSSIDATSFGATGSHLSWLDQDFSPSTSASFLWIESPVTIIKGTLYQS